MKSKKIDIDKLIILVFIIAVSIFQVVVMHSTKFDSDILWHYKLGEEIVKTYSISLSNNFSFLTGTEWIPQEWLYEIILYDIVSTMGLIGFMGICFINSIIMWVITLKNKDNKVLFVVIATILLYTTPRNTGNRPSEFSMYFLLIIICLYNKNMKNIKKLIYFILGIFIANFHGGTLIVLLAIWIIMIANDIFSDWHSKTKIYINYYGNKILELILFILGTLINPSGIKLLTTIIKIPSLNTTKYIQEWKPTEINYLLGIIIAAIIVSFGYNIGKHGIKRKDLQIILICTALLILSLHSMKAFILFDIVWMMYGYNYLEEMLYDIFYNKISKFNIIIKWLKTPIPAILIGLSIIFIQLINLGHNSFDKYVNSFTNEKIINELEDRYTDDTKILASYSNGNYILYNNMKCFVDTRQWPYAKELSKYKALDELCYIANNNDNYEKIDKFLDKYKFDYIWTSKDFDISRYLESRDTYELLISTKSNSSKTYNERLWIRKDIK